MFVTFSGTTPTVPTSTTTPTPTSTNNSLLTISTTRMNDWGNGFCDTIYISNPTTADISGWKVTFEFNAAVRGWSGNYTRS